MYRGCAGIIAFRFAAFRRNHFKGLESFASCPVVIRGRQTHGYRGAPEFQHFRRALHPSGQARGEFGRSTGAAGGNCGMEGADTALVLLGRVQRSDYRSRVLEQLALIPQGDQALADLNTGLWNDRVLKDGDLREFTVVTLSSRSAAPISYVEQPDRLYLQSSGGRYFGRQTRRSGRGTLSVAATVSLDQALALPAEFLILALPADVEPRLAVRQALPLRGWKQRLVPSIARIDRRSSA